jgi:hypothetical protein
MSSLLKSVGLRRAPSYSRQKNDFYTVIVCTVHLDKAKLALGGRGCAINPAKRFLLVAVVVLKKRVSSEALGDGGSVEKQARA